MPELVSLRLPLLMLSSLQSEPREPGEDLRLLLSESLLLRFEPLLLSERPECPPLGSATATVTLGPPMRRHVATTPIPAARRRFAWATVPLLRVAKTCRRVRIGFLHADAPSSHPFEERCKLTLAVLFILDVRTQSVESVVPALRQRREVVTRIGERFGFDPPDSFPTLAFTAHHAHRLQEQQMFGRRLAAHRDHVRDLRRRARPAVAQPRDDAQTIGIAERVEQGRLGDRGRTHTFSLSFRYLRTSSVCSAQPSLLPSNADTRCSAGMLSNPDSTMRSSTPSLVSVRVNSTNVVGACDWSAPASAAYGCKRKASRRCGSIATMCQVSDLPTCASWARATSSSTVVGVITPVTDAPATNGPSKRTPNH